jgi:hypothetical protein
MNFPAVLNLPFSKEVQVKIRGPRSSPIMMVVSVGIVVMVTEVTISIWMIMIGITTIPGAARQGQKDQQNNRQTYEMSIYHGIAPFVLF